MPENKSQYIVSLDADNTLNWNAATLEANSEKLAKDYPNAQVYQIDDYDANEEPNEAFSYIVNIGNNTLQWNAATLGANKEKLYKDYPDAKVQKVSAWQNPYIKSETQIAKENLDAFRAENGAFLDDFEARDTAERKMATANAMKGVAVPLEGGISGEERARYQDLSKQEEDLKRAYYNSPDVLLARLGRGDYIGSMQKDIEKNLSRLENDNPDAYRELRQSSARRSNPRTALMEAKSLSVDAQELQQDYANYRTAQNLLEDAIKMNNAPGRYDLSNGFVNYFKGMGETFSDVDFWSAGLTSIAENMNLRGVLSTIEEKLGNLNDLSDEAIDGILTDSEKKLLEAFVVNAETQYDRAADLSRAFQAGQGAAESAGFMAEFILTGGWSAGARKVVKAGAKKALGDYLGKLAGKAAKTAVGKYTKRLAGDAIEAAARTLVMPSTYRNMAQQAIQINKDPETGERKLASVSEFVAKGFADSFIEALAEGGRVGALGDFFGDVLGSIKPAKALIDKFKKSDIATLVKTINNTEALSMLRAGGWHGIGEEYLEEWYGAALRTVTNLEPEALKDFATVDNQLITLTSFIPMTLIGGTVSTAKVMLSKRDLEEKAALLKSAMIDRGYTESQANLLVDNLRSAPMQKISDVFTPMVNKMAEQENGNAPALMTAVADFAKASAKMQSYGYAYDEQEGAQREQLRRDLFDEIGKFWQEDAEGNRSVELSTLEDGTPVYILQHEPREVSTDGEITPVGPEAMAIDMQGNVRFINTIGKSETMSLDDYLNTRLIERRGAQEERRMAEETEQYINNIKSQIVLNQTVLNMGTQENPVQGLVVGMTPNGVMVQTQEGMVPLSWNEVGNKLSLPNPVMSDAQIEEAEVATLAAEQAAREAMLDDQFDNPVGAEENLAEGKAAEQEAEQVTYNYPLKADGSVDGNALWNENVREWIKWNNQRIADKYGASDNGADSVNYLQTQIASLEKSAKQITSNKNKETDLDKRMQLEDNEIAINKRLAELRSIFSELTGQEFMTEQEQIAATTNNVEAEQAAGAPADNAAESSKPRERSIESEVASLYDMGLNNDEVKANIEAQVERAQKALNAQSKKAPKMGADAEAYVSKKREHAAMMQELQQELDFWNGALQAVNETLSQQSVIPDTSGSVAVEDDPEPQNAVEFAARELGLRDGGIKLLWDSFKYHTGYGEAERHKFFGLFRTRQKGGMTIEEAGERLMELDRENGTGFFDQNDPNAGMNAILDALGDNQTMGELRSYTARQRQEEAQREADAAYSAMMAEYEATYGETMEESAHYDEVMRYEIFLNALSENEQQELNNIIFAEEISQNGTEGYQTEASGVYGSETGNNATDVEPGAEGVYTGGNGILQETQSDNSGRDAESPESQRGSEGESGEQDALSSVPSGESSTVPAVESSLDEDLPDFTSSASAYFPNEKMRQKFSAMRARINEWAQKLGVQVRIMETLDDVVNPSARKAVLNGNKVYGYFDPATGEVAFYLPDFLSIKGHELTEDEFLSEIDKTYIHEVVAHRGLRGLLGEEKYGALCDKVWDLMTEEEKAEYMKYLGVKGNTRVAADEFIAHLAENVDYNDNRTLWDKIVDFIKDLLPININIESNEDIADLLRHSYIKLAKSAKAATNANANQQAEGNTVFRAANGSLVGMHNISEDKLRKVIKQGGSANPSTGVIDIERQTFNSYGEISLIMPSSLVDAKTGRNAGTFTADAWTPTYPQVKKRFSDDKLQRAYWRDVSAIPEEMSHEVRMAFDSWLDDRNANGLAYMFLHERGEAPEMVRVDAKFPQEIKDKVSAILGENRSGLYKLSDEEKQAVLDLYIQENFGGSREDFDKSIADHIQRIEDRLSTGKVPSFVEKRITLDLQWMKKHGYNYDNLSSFVNNIVSDIRHAGEVNDAATTNRALDYIKDNGLEKEFSEWKESLNDRYGIKEYLFGGYTPSGNQRWLPNTVENASILMNKEGLAGATGLAVSFNRFVATLAPKKKTLSDIRASKDRLVEDRKLVDDFREKWSEVFFDLGVKCQPGANIYDDYGPARLTEAAQKKNPGAYLKKEYGVELSQEDLQRLDEMIKAIKTEFPANYFETKFQRPVYLNEFAAAVMPTTTSEDIKQAISEAGLPIFEYDSSVEGSRKEATLKATEGEGIRFRTAPSDRVLYLFNQARAGELGGKPISVGSLTKEGKEYLERISGIKLKENVSFVLNPSDLNHIYNDHYGKNEKDTGNNIPLNDYDIRRLVDVIAFPTRVVFGEDKQGRKVFYFLSETPSGTYNLMEIYANKKGNLTAKTYYKTEKGATQRVMELESLLSTSETYSGATLSDAKIPILFDIANQGNDNILFRTRITPEQDAAYMKAVESGDMEAAQRMVNEAARLAGYDSNSDYQGSLAFNGAAPSGYGYYDTKEERIEAWENGEYEDDQTLGDYKDAGIDISNLGWNLTSPVARKIGNEYTRESIKNLADAINNDSRKIKIYRAVDANIKEDSIRNGDWVTPSRAYAEYHIGLQDWKEGRIIEQEVDIDDIWWDGNDINEWGYNDGKGYTYKNTPNNRKLLAPVTYDDNGNVIPLSERFNPEKEDIRFRASNENQAIFVSNAAKAVEGIKQEKATPEQWLKMIEKNGGLKSGEDKWMGLSDWLKESDKKTLTKQEVLDFVNENMIQIEEVHYAAGAEDDAENTYAMIERILQEKFDKYIAEYYEQNSGEDDDLYGGDSYEYAMDKLREEMNDEFPYTIERSNSVVYLTFPYEETDDLQEWADKLGIKFAPQNPINSTRLDYTTDGLNNKHEIALIVPSTEPWESDEVHFGDAGDGRAVAWIRFGETWEQRPSPQISRKVLVIDEIQSKRHQEGRERGYRTSREDVAKATEAFQSFNRAMKEKYGENVFPSKWSEEDQAEFDRLRDEHARVSKSYDKGIPDAPFDKNWHELAMKRMLRYAAENGYDVIAWTKGEQQAERYNLGKFYSGIERQDNPAMEGRRFVLYGGNMDSFMVNDKGVVIESTINEAINRPLSDIVGKELAVKMMQMEDNDMLDDADITIGGEGMKGFYDKMLPAFMNKYGKRWGIKVEDIALPGLEDGNLTMHSVPVTKEMKASVMEGQVMFRARREDESAMDFHREVVDEHKSKHNDIADMEVFPVNEDTAKRFGYTLDELQNLSGLYVPSEDLIAIFAREDEADSIEVEDTIFHESTHKLVDFFDHLKAVGEWMWSVADKYKAFANLKKHIEQNYSENQYAEEIMCHMLGYTMSVGRVNELLSGIPANIKKNVEQILNEIGYDRTRESTARVLGNDGEPARISEVASEKSGSDEGGTSTEKYDTTTEGGRRKARRSLSESAVSEDLRDAEGKSESGRSGKETKGSSRAEFSAEERRLINEYFPGAFTDPIEQARQEVDQNPTDAQKEAGNYRKGHLHLDGYNITIENPKGSVRRGTDSKGNAWENTLNNDYGYIRGTEGVDGDHIDVYLSDNPTEGNVFVVDQVNPETREFDEHKVMYGFSSAEEAREAYLANFSEGWNGLGTITEVSKDEFKKWIASSHRKTKPFSEYKSVRANEMLATDESDLRYRVVTNQETLNRLNGEPTIKVYRAMQVIDGKLYPPMSAKVDGKLREPIELGQWEEAEERPDLADDKGRFKLDKGNKTSVPARYNPYFHTSRTPLNDQFSSAQDRPNLVTVEVEIPESELTSGYKAEKAKDSVGEKEWKAGVVQGKLSGTRKIILSRWDKPIRIVPDSEVADRIVEMFEDRDITMPSNVVTPSLRAELEKRGVPFVVTNNNGKPVSTIRSRALDATPTDELVTKGLQLTPARTAELAGNVFAALPEESRKKITDGLNGNILGLQDAILQIPASLAAKEEWNDEDWDTVRAIAREVQKMIDTPMNRDLHAREGLWMLYDATHKSSYDIVEAAQKAFVKDRLGFSERGMKQKEEDVRFRAATQAEIDAMERNMTAADLYNRDVTSAIMRLRESFQDMYRSVQKMIDAIVKKTGKDVKPFENIMLALNQLSSKNLADKGNFLRKYLMPMWGAVLAFKEKGYSIDDVTRYVMLKHGLERNDVLAQRDARNYYKDAYYKKVREIEADKSLSDTEKQKKKDKAKADYDFHLASIESGSDAKYRELRERDYGAVMALYSDYVDIPDRMPGETIEQFNQRQKMARRPKFTDLAVAEAEAAREVDAFENANRALCDRLWRSINAATKETLKHQYEHNVISKQAYDHVKGMFKFYVPLRGFKEDTAEDIYSYYGKDISTDFANPLIKTKGRTTLAESPFGWIGSMAESAIQMDNKNDAKMRLYYFASNRPDQNLLTLQKTWYKKVGEDSDGKSIWEASYPKITPDMDHNQTHQELERHDAEMKVLAASGQATQKKSELNLRNSVVNISDKAKPEHAITILIGGEERVMYVNGNPRAAQAINGMLNIDRGDSGIYRVLGQKITRWMAQLNTSYNPAFWISNYQRDLLFTIMGINIKEDKDYQKLFWSNYTNPAKVTQLLRKYEKGELDMSNSIEKAYKEFADNGGVTGYTVLANNEEYDKLLEKYARDAERSKFLKGAKKTFGAIQDFGEGVEQASRFAAYLTSRQVGRSIEEAIGDAKDVTVNFNRKGSGKAISWNETAGLSYGRYIDSHPKLKWCARVMTMLASSLAPAGRSVYMFFNASIQGLKAFVSLYKKNPGKAAMWSGAFFGMGFALAALNHMINAMLGGDDDDYLDIPDWERRNNILIGGGGFYLKWALPQEARPFYAVADIILNKVLGRSPDENLVEEIGRALLEVLPVNPLGEGGFVQAVVPSALSPIYEIWQNTDYKGMPLYRESYWSTGEEPKYDKAFTSTGKVFVEISRLLNNVTGGDYAEAGAINIHPAAIEHIIEGYGGGTVTFFNQLLKTLTGNYGEGEWSVRNTPFLNRVVTINDERYRNSHTSDLFRYYEELAKETKRIYSVYKSNDDIDKVDELMDQKRYEIMRIYENYRKREKRYDDLIRDAEDDREKRELMAEQDEMRRDMIQEISELP